MNEWGDPTGVGLNLQQFAWAMKRGLGRAVLHAQDGLNEAELGILRSWYAESPAYDRQLEDSRAGHVYAVAAAAGDLAQLREDLARYLECEDHPKEEAESWYPVDLASLFWKHGDTEMESILIGFLKRGVGRGIYCGAFDLVSQGGGAMLVRVASIVGPHLDAKEKWRTRVLIHLAAGDPKEEETPEHERLRELLRDAAKDDPGVAAFIRVMEGEDYEGPDEDFRPAGETFEDLLRVIAEIKASANPPPYGKARHCVGRWAFQSATEEEYEKAVKWFTATREPFEFKALTNLFHGERPYPGPIDVLVRRALDEQDPCHGSLPWVLANCDGEEIAEAARELMRRGRFDPWVIQMFSARENDDDAAYVLEQLQGREWESDKDLHDVALGVRTLCDSTESDAWGPVAEWVYETTPCSFCRGGVFEYLAEQGLLTHERALEGVHDSDSTVRKHAKQFLGMPPDDDDE